MKHLIFMIGAPGSGKTSTLRYLNDSENGFDWFSMGELFRNEIALGSGVGMKIKHFLDQGICVPVDIALRMLLKNVLNSTSETVIVDGFPRDCEQMYRLEECLLNHKEIRFLGLIEIGVSNQTAMKRCIGRNRGFDDSIDIFKKRMKFYKASRKSIIQFYSSEYNYVLVNGNNALPEVSLDMKKALYTCMKQKDVCLNLA